MIVWWFVFVPLCFGWVFPMLAMKRVGAPAWAFVLIAAFWGLVALMAEPMYDWSTGVGRRLGHERVAALRERLKPEVLPAARAALAIMAVISLVFAMR